VANSIDPALRQAITSLSQPGLLVDGRLIAPGDEHVLLEPEVQSMPSGLLPMRRASGAARIVARKLLPRLGFAPSAIPKAPSGMPVWPDGVIGSLAHNDILAVAAVGLAEVTAAVGIDVEPARILPPDILDLVATAREKRNIAVDPCGGRLLFAAKEAVYKAVYPLDRMFLEYHDIEIDIPDRRALLPGGRAVLFRFCVSSHLVVLALA
jgi:4'-phosphopantetheinyl transferase EntD